MKTVRSQSGAVHSQPRPWYGRSFSCVSALAGLCCLGAWLNYVATARVNEGEVQINYFSDFFFAELHLIQYVVFLSCGFSCEDVL